MNIDTRYFVFSVVVLILVVLTAGCTGSSTPAAASSPAATGTAAPVTAHVTSSATPNLVGVWTGTTTGNTKVDGFRETNTARYNITAQNGQAFSGSKDYTRANGVTYHENFSGVVDRNGKISIAGHVAGVMSGELIGQNEAEFTFLQPGDDAKAFIIHLTRQQG